MTVDAAELPPAALLTPGPGRSDTDLAAWRDAAQSGQLPDPNRKRWQILRAGVVNLWEFDQAEYWFAGGRAQFVGQNQSGKSTLMALTTLIMLAGDLDRRYVDTFGESHKSFRYYVEPTEDPTDRRDTSDSLNRGWAWVEYGRVVGDQLEFFTTLLFAQSRRGAQDYVKTWATCTGQTRVGWQLQLLNGAHAALPGEVSSVDGFRTARSGEDYRQRIASGLFGFDDADRLESVIEMLKVLRTPHLGQRLNPQFVTDRMREALPAIAQSEIDELAEGWDQLDKLAADRDSAEEAELAVRAFLRKAWNPWADTVLRRHADALAAAVTRADDVTRRIREAQTQLDQAKVKVAWLDTQLKDKSDEHERDNRTYEELLKSRAYQDAAAATERVADLRKQAEKALTLALATARDADTASGNETRTQAALTTEQDKHQKALNAQQTALEGAVTDAVAAALPAAYSQWAADGDFPRMTQAVADRKGHVRRGQQLLGIMGSKASAENAAARRLADAQAEQTSRAEQVTTADSEREQALQTLSDLLEAWAAKVGPDAPTSEVRTDWVEEVLAQADAPAPVSVLGRLLGAQWLTPATTRLREQAAAHEQSARQRATEAGTLTAQLRALEAQTEPEPSAPARWTRRRRPVSGDAGAPLWRLLDPAPGLPVDVLDRLEAALDATGLLDAWVSPDGVYVADRDGHDSVVHLSATLPGPTVGITLGTVLVPAANAGALTAALTGLLAQVAYRDAGQPLPDSTAGGIAVSGDGRWVSSTRCGTAGPGPHGAELIGTAAQTAKRDRDIAALRGQIEDLEREQQELAGQARNLRDAAAEYDRHAQTAPDDGEVVAAAHGCLTAARELDAADRTLTLREQEHRKAAIEADEARSTLLEFATLHRLPTTDGALRTVSQALDKVAASRGALELAVLKASSAREHVQRAQETFDAAAEFARTHRDRAEQQRRDANEAQDSADSAEGALGQSEKEILTSVAELDQRRTELAAKVKQLQGQVSTQQAAVGTATERLTNEGRDREAAEAARQGALTAWWVPVDAGLAAARGVPDVEERNLSQAVRQARAAREQLRPASWPDSPDASADKDSRVNLAYSKMAGTALIELRAVLEANGGRTASVQDAGESAPLPAVTVLVDSSGALVPPHEAADRLAEQASKLRQQHDDKMQQVLVELLSSTFVEHLREQLKGVVTLLARVNDVLEAHPTGASRTQLRLERQPASHQSAAFNVLNALEQQFVDGDAVQEQIRSFLEQQIREAQDLGRTGDLDWKEHLAQLLDYRKWFDVVTKYRVHGDGRWKPLTAEVHAKDSGGGKVVTLLQPLLATLVALYDESTSAPRPLWLDEAFTGVDDINRSTMLDLLVEFDLDFLLAGPAALVTAAQVPSAAAWFVTRAPAPDPGVDLSLMLWAGNRLELVTCPTVGFGGGAGRLEPSTDPDRPSLFDAVTEP